MTEAAEAVGDWSAIAGSDATIQKAQPTLQASATKARRVNRGALPAHMPPEEIVIAPDPEPTGICGWWSAYGPSSDRAVCSDAMEARDCLLCQHTSDRVVIHNRKSTLTSNDLLNRSKSNM